MTERMRQRAWQVGLMLYALGVAADMAAHLAADQRAGEDWRAPDNLAVAFSASLFWPLDLVAQVLLTR